MVHAVASFITFSAMFGWIVLAPVLLMKHLHFTAVEFGWICFIMGTVAMTIGGYINAKLVERLGIKRMLLSGLCLGIFYIMVGLNAVLIILMVFLMMIGTTLIWPNAFAGAFAPFEKNSGYAGAMYSTIQLGGAGIVGAIIAELPDNTPLPFAFLVIGAALSAMLLYAFYSRHSSGKSEVPLQH